MSINKVRKDMEMLVEDWFGLEKESIITNLRICVDSFLTLEILSRIFLDSVHFCFAIPSRATAREQIQAKLNYISREPSPSFPKK